MSRYLFASLVLCFGAFNAQEKESLEGIVRKKVVAVSSSLSPKVDGDIHDEVWNKAIAVGNFVERSPKNGAAVAEEFRTEVKVLYNDIGVFVMMKMYDPSPSKIARELTERDSISNDDFVGITLNGYNDKQQSLEFVVTAAGVQYDARLTSNGEDRSWNAIWQSEVKMTDFGWTAEFMIPFSELRFPKKEIQEWGVNFFRKVQRENRFYDWNFVDNKKNSYTLFDGILEGIQDIKPPTRLSFMPYFSSYVNRFDGKTSSNVNGGMDIKYGINDAFTVDLTLIPDFGQANFDNSILNLSPFEQEFSEQRSFFTEGTELFSIGNLFYSRRIGGSPSGSPHLEENESLVESYGKVKLFNAFKLSGRTSKGLGIGFFNAVTQKMDVAIRNERTGEERKETVEPWANYNVFVLDQRFNENSSVSLINTNTTRAGDFRDANATGFLWSINNKANTWNTYGSLRGSWVMTDETKFGTKNQIGLSKIDGKHRFDFNAMMTSKDWDINDLGFSTRTNFANYNAWYGYRLLQPSQRFNKVYLNFNLQYYQRWSPYLFNNFIFSHNNQFQNKKFQSYGFGVETTPFGEKDIYEARSVDRFVKVPAYLDAWIWMESDSRKKFQFNVNLDYYAYDEKARNQFLASFITRYRFSDQFNVFWQLSPSFSNNEKGYVGKEDSELIIGRRQRNTVENSINSQFTFNNKMALNMAFRHYFSDVTYKDFYILQEAGDVLPTSHFTKNLNGTYNAWNIDLRYTWWFAPGSQLSFLYRNAIQNYLNESRLGMKNNYNELFKEPSVHNFSVKLVYYLDYNRVKTWR